MPLLGVNIDHVATIRQARRGLEPDPVLAALECERAGADSIVAHLREDRRHILDHDVYRLKKSLHIRFNLEMSIAPEIVNIACKVRPDQVTLVPEKRQELTTEGGLDVVRQFSRLKETCARFQDKGIEVSLFIDPVDRQIEASRRLNVEAIELHTGCYADARSKSLKQKELKKLVNAAARGIACGLVVNAGHGLKYHDTSPIARIHGMNELNIGHSIISRAAFVGIFKAVREMRAVIRKRDL